MKSDPTLIVREHQWVIDTPRVRGFHNKTVKIKDKGVFRMFVSDVAPDGSKKNGHVLVVVEAEDTDAVITTIRDL